VRGRDAGATYEIFELAVLVAGDFWIVQLSIGLNRALALVAEKGKSKKMVMDCCAVFLTFLAIHAYVKGDPDWVQLLHCEVENEGNADCGS
jgi:hypothetical protein